MPIDDKGKNDSLDNDKKVDTNNSHSEVNSVNIKLAPFWPNSPSTWFIQTEAQFGIARLTSEITKYNYVVAALPQDVAESMTDILENPPTTNQYSNIKNILIERHSLSIEKRIRKLVSDESMGDKKPSEFFRTLKKLAGTSGTVGEEFLKKLWFNRLPNLLNIALIPHKDESTEKTLKVADQVWEAMQASNVSMITMNSNNQNDFSIASSSFTKSSRDVDPKYDKLENEIKELKQMISSLSMNSNRSRSPHRRESNSRFQSNSRSRFNSKGRLCWYHFKFGSNATKCIAPCQHKSSISNSSSNSNQSSKN